MLAYIGGKERKIMTITRSEHDEQRTQKQLLSRRRRPSPRPSPSSCAGQSRVCARGVGECLG